MEEYNSALSQKTEVFTVMNGCDDEEQSDVKASGIL